MVDGIIAQALSPYWESDEAVLYHGDCRDVLPLLQTVDLIVTDPPYGVDYKSGWTDGEKIPGDDGSLDVAACLDLAVGKLNIARHAYAFECVFATIV